MMNNPIKTTVPAKGNEPAFSTIDHRLTARIRQEALAADHRALREMLSGGGWWTDPFSLKPSVSRIEWDKYKEIFQKEPGVVYITPNGVMHGTIHSPLLDLCAAVKCWILLPEEENPIDFPTPEQIDSVGRTWSIESPWRTPWRKKIKWLDSVESFISSRPFSAPGLSREEHKEVYRTRPGVAYMAKGRSCFSHIDEFSSSLMEAAECCLVLPNEEHSIPFPTPREVAVFWPRGMELSLRTQMSYWRYLSTNFVRILELTPCFTYLANVSLRWTWGSWWGNLPSDSAFVYTRTEGRLVRVPLEEARKRSVEAIADDLSDLLPQRKVSK